MFSSCYGHYIGFYDQPPSQESGSLNPVVVAKFKWIFAWFSDQVVAKANVDYLPRFWGFLLIEWPKKTIFPYFLVFLLLKWPNFLIKSQN